MLSENEKLRIREELAYREEFLQELRPKKKGIARLFEIVNQPAIVTILGGLILAIVASYLQERSSKREQAILRHRQIIDKKYDLLESFCKEFERDLTLYYGIRMKELALCSDKEDPLGRLRPDKVKEYIELRNYYYQNCHPQALLQKIPAMFRASDTVSDATNLIVEVREFMELETPQQA